MMPSDHPSWPALVEHLKAHSIKRGDFTLKSGAKSSWFLDSKQTACDPDGVVLMADVALSIIPDDATAIGGITVGADPVAYGVAAIGATRGRRLRSFTIRKEAKDHGVMGRIAGPLRPGDKVVITEDTTSRGSTIAEAVAVVREAGAEPVLVIALVDRGGTAAGYAAAAGVRFVALAGAPDLGFPYDSGSPSDT
jgi:orotate phosphoribosyltransferase